MKQFLAGWLPHLSHLKLKNNDCKQQESFVDKFLGDIVTLYFSKMKIPTDKKINPTITQNKVILYASEAAFFKHNPKPSQHTATTEPKINSKYIL